MYTGTIVAFGGDRGISKVEVSIDSGATWKSAVIKNPLSQYTWIFWTAGFTPAGNENYKIIVRATDKTGQVQTVNSTSHFRTEQQDTRLLMYKNLTRA